MELPTMINPLEALLNGDEEIVTEIGAAMGPRIADQYVSEFNNACMQMCGFEELLASMKHRDDVFYAPPANVSYSQDH